MSARNNLDLDSDPRVIEGMRVLDAPRALVFEVFTDPEHLTQWWGPDGFTTTTSRFDFRPGGIWRFVMHGPDGRDYQNRITFADLGGKTRVTWRGEFASAEDRARVIRDYGADQGLVQTMARLADYVAARVAQASQ